MKLKQILNSTMSFYDNNFVKTMELSQIKIFRRNPSGQKPITIITSIEENIELQNGDHITIPRKFIFSPIESVSISGEVTAPGVYPVNKLTSLQDLIKSAGGFTDLALQDGIEIFRDSLKIGWDSRNFILKDGDSLNVVKKSGLVQVLAKLMYQDIIALIMVNL